MCCKHVREYFDRAADVPRVLDLGVGLADHLPFGALDDRLRSPAATSGAWPSSSSSGRSRPTPWTACTGCGGSGSGFVVDLLGREDRHRGRGRPLRRARGRAGHHPAVGHRHLGARRPSRARRSRPAAPGGHLASSRPRWPPTTPPSPAADGLARAKARLRPILKLCAEQGAIVWFDMEHFDAKDLTLQLFRELLAEPETGRPRQLAASSRPTPATPGTISPI